MESKENLLCLGYNPVAGKAINNILLNFSDCICLLPLLLFVHNYITRALLFTRRIVYTCGKNTFFFFMGYRCIDLYKFSFFFFKNQLIC